MTVAPGARVALDHHLYPHILANILDLACPLALVALRATSKSVKAVCDRRLFTHAYYSDYIHGVCPERADYAGAGFETASEDINGVAQHVRLLDLLAATLPATFNRVRTVRLTHHNYRASEFDVLTSSSAWRMVLFHDPNPFDLRIPIPPSVRRLVLHIKSLPWIFLEPLAVPPGVDFVVLLLNVQGKHERIHETLSWIIDGASMAETITVVGLPHSVDQMALAATHTVSCIAHGMEGRKALDRLKFLSWATFKLTSPHFGLDVEPQYRLTMAEHHALAFGSDATLDAMNL